MQWVWQKLLGRPGYRTDIDGRSGWIDGRVKVWRRVTVGQSSRKSDQRVRTEAETKKGCCFPHSANLGPEISFHSVFEKRKGIIFSATSQSLCYPASWDTGEERCSHALEYRQPTYLHGKAQRQPQDDTGQGRSPLRGCLDQGRRCLLLRAHPNRIWKSGAAGATGVPGCRIHPTGPRVWDKILCSSLAYRGRRAS
jgi:hypothetical protein